MFDRVFSKKREENNRTDLTRRNRIDKAAEYIGRRPRTAPPSGAATPESAESSAAMHHRRSLGEHSISSYPKSGETFRYLSTERLASSSSFLPSAAGRPASATALRSRAVFEDCPCPRMVPQSPAGTFELRNPFRSDTNDSFSTMGRSDSFDSFADTTVPVHRTVRASRPVEVTADASHNPQRAAIFTTATAGGQSEQPPWTATAITDPFTDAHATSDSTSPPPQAMTNDATSSDEPMTQQPVSRIRRWSILRSPKRGSRDFLQVHIPTGVMSPVRESRLAFWSKA
ncbi:hypothetical protein BD414DRAFT_135277 [Trametes punicea]|nr:hypothetical protein BD414DRAFT_135277 [Trametes punicea]